MKAFMKSLLGYLDVYVLNLSLLVEVGFLRTRSATFQGAENQYNLSLQEQVNRYPSINGLELWGFYS